MTATNMCSNFGGKWDSLSPSADSGIHDWDSWESQDILG